MCERIAKSQADSRDWATAASSAIGISRWLRFDALPYLPIPRVLVLHQLFRLHLLQRAGLLGLLFRRVAHDFGFERTIGVVGLGDEATIEREPLLLLAADAGPTDQLAG